MCMHTYIPIRTFIHMYTCKYIHNLSVYVIRFPKRVLYLHSFKTHFSLPSVSYINAPTGYVFTTAES